MLMSYIVEYEICALVFLIFVTSQFFTNRHFPNIPNKIFGIILWWAVADLSLDIISAFTIEAALEIPFWINYVINTAVYILQIIFPVLVLFYTLALAGLLLCQNIKALTIMVLPASVIILLLFAVNPFTGMFFYLDPVLGYIHGAWFYMLHIVNGCYMAVIFVMINCHRVSLQKKQYNTIFQFLLLVTMAMIIQAFYPALLVTGVAIALAITMMCATLQNRQNMLDPITGVFNYGALIEFLGELIKDGKDFRIIAAEIHDVGRINRMFGLNGGNQALSNVGHFLSQDSDDIWVFRMTGTRFVAVTCNETDYMKLKGEIALRFEQPWDIGITGIILSATVCCMSKLNCSSYSRDDVVNLLGTAFSNADRNGYRGKMFCTDKGLLEELNRVMAVENALQEALEQGTALEPYFQPIYSISKKRFVGAEALLRFYHAEMGMISPSEFVPIAEKHGLVLKMDEMMVKKVCDFIVEYDMKNALGLDYLGINLSAAEFMNRQMPEKLTALLDTYKIDPAFLVFEITETVATASHDIVYACMKAYRDKGYRFALDDFGIGYANISQVVGLPFSMVKIDRSILLNSTTVLEDMLHMFSHLDLLTVVEGVETREQSELLHTMGADCIQGFFFARPMPVAEFVAFMKEQIK